MLQTGTDVIQEAVTQNYVNCLMPKGKGNKSTGGNPSKKELARRQQQSRRDKQAAKGKSKGPNRKRKGGFTDGFKVVARKTAPLAKGERQVNVNGTKVRSHRHSTFMGAFTTTITGTFTEMVSFPFNPAQQTCDAWGFPIAGRYESYGPVKGKSPFRVRIEPRNAATTDGETFVSIQYNAEQDAPTTSQQMLQHSRASRAQAWMKNQIVAEPDATKQKNRYYCRTGAQPANTDIREYDMCNVYVFYEGITLAKTFDVWIDIDVLLYDPWIPVNGETPNTGDYLHYRATFVAGPNIWGTYTRISGDGALQYAQAVGASADNGVAFTSKGYYLVTMNIKAVGGTFTTNISDGASTAATVTGWSEAGSVKAAAFTGGHAIWQALYYVSAPGQFVSLLNPAGIGNGDIMDFTTVFIAHENAFNGNPTLSKGKKGSVAADSLEEKVQQAVARMMPAIKRELTKQMVLTVEDPPSPETSAAAGGKPAPELSLEQKTNGVKNDVRGMSGKGKAK
jgi:hypothetical protein